MAHKNFDLNACSDFNALFPPIQKIKPGNIRNMQATLSQPQHPGRRLLVL
jgi:hypothetical protein